MNKITTFVKVKQAPADDPKGNEDRGPLVLNLLQCNVSRRLTGKENKKVQVVRTASRSVNAGGSTRRRGRFPRPALRGNRSTMLAVAAGALAAAAFVNRQMTRKAQRQNPPVGQFLDVDGVRLHYLERGRGEPLVLLHGNGSMIQDFAASGLIDMAAEKYRVIVFDRPGYGYSERPRRTIWTPQAQADLLHRALRQINVSHAVVLGHSWGASVAVALALDHPDMVRSLVLASGYYYPSVRGDVVVLSPPAIPLIGDIVRHTVSPLAGRLLWPLIMRKIFGPASVPPKFAKFPKEMALRPSQLRAGAAESLMMIPDAFAYRASYSDLRMPVVIIAGEDDRLVDTDRQSRRLHHEISQSVFRCLRGVGHMVHQTAPAAVMSAIDQAAESRAVGAKKAGRAAGK